MNNIVWILKPLKDNSNYIDLVVNLSNKEGVDLSNYDVSQVSSVVYSFKDEIVEHLLNNGFSSLISADLLLEDVVAKDTPANKIIPLLQRYLDKIGIKDELIIVDPYFFAKSKNPDYVTIVIQVLAKYLLQITQLIFITNYSIDATLKAAIEFSLKKLNPSLNIIHQLSYDYHDRFWISGDREKGVVMGTSLNGLGNKLALVDRLNIVDVRLIVKELISDGLI
ncbi:hypothetical protein BDD43_0188 [Mucilaginibacter gracilis]|uniref:Uncharacterized protein n=1 Tax=Mucilaginibacter gracilis TaxID=423350 RepID=A0A495IVP8_9SPHI|nr:hypothetical protein [Mucilaginibacter gracilis]RKR80094.1 hypothetical protein BDD43_0188 [Mucilaginibacter gracilis]